VHCNTRSRTFADVAAGRTAAPRSSRPERGGAVLIFGEIIKVTLVEQVIEITKPK